MEKIMEIPPKVKLKLLFDQKNSASGIYTEQKEHQLRKMFIVILFTVWKQPKCSSVNEWVKRFEIIYITPGPPRMYPSMQYEKQRHLFKIQETLYIGQ